MCSEVPTSECQCTTCVSSSMHHLEAFLSLYLQLILCSFNLDVLCFCNSFDTRVEFFPKCRFSSFWIAMSTCCSAVVRNPFVHRIVLHWMFISAFWKYLISQLKTCVLQSQGNQSFDSPAFNTHFTN